MKFGIDVDLSEVQTIVIDINDRISFSDCPWEIDFARCYGKYKSVIWFTNKDWDITFVLNNKYFEIINSCRSGADCEAFFLQIVDLTKLSELINWIAKNSFEKGREQGADELRSCFKKLLFMGD
jgi:hypothetical protein